MSKPISLNRTVAWFNKTEGRDKICKTIQYGSRFLMWHMNNKGNKELSNQFQGLFSKHIFYDKLIQEGMQLAKTLNEIQKIIEIINTKNIDDVQKILQLLQRISFGLYWIFDNLAILSTIKFLNRDPSSANKSGMTFWFLALVFGFILAIKDLVEIKQKQLKMKAARVQGDSQPNDAQKYADLKRKETQTYLTIIKVLGDFIPASQGSQIFPRLTGKNFNDGAIGLGGLVSGVISAYEAY